MPLFVWLTPLNPKGEPDKVRTAFAVRYIVKIAPGAEQRWEDWTEVTEDPDDRFRRKPRVQTWTPGATVTIRESSGETYQTLDIHVLEQPDQIVLLCGGRA